MMGSLIIHSTPVNPTLHLEPQDIVDFPDAYFSNNVLISPVIAVVYILIMIFGVIIIALNVLIILVYHYTKRLQTITFMIIVSLAMADLITGICVPVAKAWIYIYESMHDHGLPRRFRALHWSMQCFPMLLSRSHLLCIASERYLSIVHPTFHRTYISRRLCKLVLSVTWVVSLVISFLPARDIGTSDGPGTTLSMPYVIAWTVGYHIVADGLIVYFYIRIIYVVKYSKNKRKPDARNKKMFKLVGVTILAFELCWLPFMIVYGVIQSNKLKDGSNPSIYLASCVACTHLLAFLNSGINIFIYAGMNSEFRQRLKNMSALLTGNCRIEDGSHAQSISSVTT